MPRDVILRLPDGRWRGQRDGVNSVLSRPDSAKLLHNVITRNGAATTRGGITLADKRTAVQATTFNGTTDYVDVADNAAWANIATPFAICFTFKMPTLSVGATKILFDRNSATANSDVSVSVTNDGGTKKLIYLVGNSGTITVTNTVLDGILVSGQWAHVALLAGNLDGTTRGHLVVNGIMMDRTAALTWATSNDGWRIGATDVAAGAYFTGSIIGFQVWTGKLWTISTSTTASNRKDYLLRTQAEPLTTVVGSAISKTDITLLGTATCIGYWPLDERSLTIAYDRSATAVNGVWSVGGAGSAIDTQAANALIEFQGADGTVKVLSFAGTRAYDIISNGSELRGRWTALGADAALAGTVSTDTMSDTLWIASATNKLRDNGSYMTRWGFTTPSAVSSTVLTVGGGSLSAGDYTTKITEYDAHSGTESALSAVSATKTAAAGDRLSIQLPIAVNPRTTHFKVYRTQAAGSTYLFDQYVDVSSALTTFFSTQADTALGTAASAENGAPPSDYTIVKAFNGRLYLANSATNVSTVRYSDADLAESWPTANTLQTRSPLVSMGVSYSNLVLLCQRMVARVSDPLAGVFEVSDRTGCMAAYGVASVGGWVYFLGPTGLWQTNGAATDYLGYDIEATWANVKRSNTSQIGAVYWSKRRMLLFAVNGGTTYGTATHNDIILAYDLDEKDWGVWDVRADRFAVVAPGTTSEDLWIQYYLEYTTVEQVVLGRADLTTVKVDWSNGFAGALTGTVTSATASTLVSTGAGFTSALAGGYVWITGGTGAGQRRLIADGNVTITVNNNWTTIPDSTSTFALLLIDHDHQTPDLDFGTSREKYVSYAQILYLPSTATTNATVEFYANRASTPTVTATVSFDAAGGFVRVPCELACHLLSVRVRERTPNKTITLERIELFARVDESAL